MIAALVTGVKKMLITLKAHRDRLLEMQKTRKIKIANRRHKPNLQHPRWVTKNTLMTFNHPRNLDCRKIHLPHGSITVEAAEDSKTVTKEAHRSFTPFSYQLKSTRSKGSLQFKKISKRMNKTNTGRMVVTHVCRTCKTRNTMKSSWTINTLAAVCRLVHCMDRTSKVCRFWTSFCWTWFKSTIKWEMSKNPLHSCSFCARLWNGFLATVRTRRLLTGVSLNLLSRSCLKHGRWGRFMKGLGKCLSRVGRTKDNPRNNKTNNNQRLTVSWWACWGGGFRSCTNGRWTLFKRFPRKCNQAHSSTPRTCPSTTCARQSTACLTWITSNSTSVRPTSNHEKNCK